MGTVDGLTVHERTAPDDWLNATSPTLRYSIVGDAARAKGAVEPDVPNAPIERRACGLKGRGRMSRDDNAVDGPRNTADIGVAGLPLELPHVGIDGHNLVARRDEFAEDGVGRRRSGSRHASDDDAFALEERSNGRREIGHGDDTPEPA